MGTAPDLAATQAFYGRWARLYDSIATGPFVGNWREHAVAALGLEPGDVVVEMGCGTGANLPYLASEVGPTGRIVGVDITGNMLSRARERVHSQSLSQVSLVQADASDPPIDGPVDAVLGSFVTGMFESPGQVVDRWLDLLAPGGRLAILEAGRSNWLVALPLNALFKVFVMFSTPRSRRAQRVEPTWQVLDRRLKEARDALVARTERRRYEEFALGFVRLLSGQQPTDHPGG
jgi:ubiquinone/menaquinone biosynthesis C-methylase UbiE